MSQYKFTSKDFVPEADSTIPDAALCDEDIVELQKLSGIRTKVNESSQTENISHTAMARVEYMKKHKIKPGTDDWFKLWFSLPYLTGNTGMDK